MDSISSQSHAPLRPSQLNQLYGANRSPSKQASPSGQVSEAQISRSSTSKLEKVEAFASMFDDSELARLQENLETIARRAESALRQLSGRA